MPLALNQRRPLIDDPRQAAVERAVKAATEALLSREIGIREALATVGIAMGGTSDGTATPRELAAAGRQAYRAEVVAEIRLEMDGRGRDAALIVARRHAADVRDPIEVETLANKFRRWRRAEEKRACARLPSLQSDSE
jgi:hypothetical protein